MVTFVECMEVYFGSRLGLSNGCEHAIREGWMSKTEAEIVEEFHKVARDYKSPFERAGPFRRIFIQNCDSEVLADPRWAEDEGRWGKII
jgi:hypothetical protein